MRVWVTDYLNHRMKKAYTYNKLFQNAIKIGRQHLCPNMQLKKCKTIEAELINTKKMKTILTMLATALLAASVQAQTTDNQNTISPQREIISIGSGIGFDYCGFGVGATVYPLKYIGVYANGGVFLAGASYVVGLKGRYITKSTVDPYITVGYGYSGGVAVTDEDNRIDKSKSKIYYRMNFGFGADIHFASKLCLSAGLTTNRAVGDIEVYQEKLERQGYDFGNSVVFPVGFTVGIKWKIR